MQSVIRQSATRRPANLKAGVTPYWRAAQGETRLSATTLWRETAATFSAQAVPIILIALLGFAGSGVVGAVLTAGPDEEVGLLPRLAAAAVGFGVLALAQGALTWLGLRGPVLRTSRMNLARLMRATLARAPALLVSALVWTGAMALTDAGLAPLVAEYRQCQSVRTAADMRDMVPAVEAHVHGDRAASSFSALVVISTLNLVRFRQDMAVSGVRSALGLDAGLPEMALSSARRAGQGVRGAAPPYAGLGSMAPPPSGFRLSDSACAVAAGAIVLSITVGTVLRLRAAAAMQPGHAGLVRPGMCCLRLGLKHFGLVFLHAGLLNAAGAVISLAFVVAPSLFILNVFLPVLAMLPGWGWCPAVIQASITVASCTAAAMLSAFGALFDARLYVALRRSQH